MSAASTNNNFNKESKITLLMLSIKDSINAALSKLNRVDLILPLPASSTQCNLMKLQKIGNKTLKSEDRKFRSPISKMSSISKVLAGKSQICHLLKLPRNKVPAQ